VILGVNHEPTQPMYGKNESRGLGGVYAPLKPGGGEWGARRGGNRETIFKSANPTFDGGVREKLLFSGVLKNALLSLWPCKAKGTKRSKKIVEGTVALGKTRRGDVQDLVATTWATLFFRSGGPRGGSGGGSLSNLSG